MRSLCSRIGAAVALLAFARAIPANSAIPSPAELDAQARASGNRKAEAVHLGRALFATTWPAQVTVVRVDGVGAHAVAGIVISGVKFHGRLDPRAFTAEVIALARRVFVASDVEEVDMWATVPIALTSHARAPNGEYLAPEARTVYAVTVLRRERASFAQRLKRGDDVFWDPGWRRSLTAP